MILVIAIMRAYIDIKGFSFNGNKLNYNTYKCTKKRNYFIQFMETLQSSERMFKYIHLKFIDFFQTEYFCVENLFGIAILSTYINVKTCVFERYTIR